MTIFGEMNMEQKKADNSPESSFNEPIKKSGMKRRDILKGLAGLPVFGIFIYEFFKKRFFDQSRKKNILSELSPAGQAPAVVPKTTIKKSGELIRLGIIGLGNRGPALLRAAGFAHPEWIEKMSKKRTDEKYNAFMAQEDLNVVIAGICDVFDLHAERGLTIANSGVRPNNVKGNLGLAKRYRRYQEMLESKDIDAVIITTPDHHHAQMTIDAVNAGKHVYCEKCMTRTEDEVYQVADTVKKSGMVFQLGHQYPQSEAFKRAKEIVKNNILGKINLVETTTNRNTPDGAYIRHLDKDGNLKPGSPETIDWEQWLGSRPKVPFSLDRFYNWTKWFDYATGLSGQLLCHEIDAVNQILDTGIPESAVASGGIYFYKDNREIPDIFHVVYEFPNKDLTLIYSATLASSRSRGRVFMGHDASMEVDRNLNVMVDSNSTRFKEKIENGIIDTSLPLFAYQPGHKGIDAVTSATEKYYATRGLTYTYLGNKTVYLTYLHVKEWLNCIRNGGQPSCPIEKGFEVTIATHMATKSYLEKRPVHWDPIRKKIV